MSSLFAALNVAVGGLSAQSQAIGNISDNLSNSQTTGYKDIATSFSDLVTASSATNNSPGGVQATPSYLNDVQGTIATTTTTTNLAISGQGFFEVSGATQTAAGATDFTGTYYTRDGDFTLNKDGYMQNSAGYYLEGYAIASNGSVNTTGVSPVQVSSLLDNPVATTTINYVANLPASATSTYTSSSSTVNIYDALGTTHTTSVVWAKTSTANVWQATVDVAGGGGLTDDYKAVFNVTFNSGSSNAGTISSLTGVSAGYYNSSTGALDTTTSLSAPTVSSGSSADVTLANLTFAGAGTQSVDFNLGTFDAATGVTQYANSSTSVSVSSISQDGLGEGSYSSLGINSSGVVSINYTNGSTRSIYQIPIVLFNSPDNLQRQTGGVYSATLASGTANLHSAGTNGAGTIASSSLEASDVDIASEFTTMIQAQQVYSANAKVVTTVNKMLDTIIQSV